MKILLFFLFIFFNFFTCQYLEAKIIYYDIVNYYIKDNNGKLYLATRFFKTDKNIEYILAIDCNTFNTTILLNSKINKINNIDKINNINDIFYNKQPLANALKTQATLKLNNQNNKNIFLTIDLCPSSKIGFEKILFEELIAYGKKNKKNINIAIAITARWIEKHPKEFALLKKWHAKGIFNITWVNHSYTHFYSTQLNNDNNFMLYNKKDFYNEVINNEIFMLEKDITPSIFFRFPGLVYDKDLLNKISKLSLVVLDSDAWLVKTKGKFTNGSIILVHGNKNEPLGINIFITLLQKGNFDDYNFASLSKIYSKE